MHDYGLKDVGIFVGELGGLLLCDSIGLYTMGYEVI